MVRINSSASRPQKSDNISIVNLRTNVLLYLQRLFQHNPTVDTLVRTYSQFNSCFLIARNNSPCNGLVSMSAIISFVDKCSIWISPALMRSLMKKYLMLMCLVRSDVERPFSASLIVLMLSSYTVAGPILYPWPSGPRKFRVQIV